MMGSTETAFKFQIDLKINGNKRDSKTEWEDARNKITRNCAIQAFLGAVGNYVAPGWGQHLGRGVGDALQSYFGFRRGGRRGF
jgi:hypothetical protein